MADDFDVSPRDVPGRRDGWDDERRIHAPGGSVVVTVPIVMPGGGGHSDHHDHHDSDRFPNTVEDPLPDNAQIDVRVPSTTSRWGWRRGVINVLDFIRSFWPASYSWSGLNLLADVPLTTLFTAPARDMVYLLVYSVACKVAGAGSGTITLTVNFTPLNGAASPVTATSDLTIAANGSTTSVARLISSGSSVTFRVVNAGAYLLGASYDVIVSAIPLCSDVTPNRSDNLMV